MENKHCIRIESLYSDGYSEIFVDEILVHYCEYPYELAEKLTKIITDFQNKNEQFFLTSEMVEFFSDELEWEL